MSIRQLFNRRLIPVVLAAISVTAMALVAIGCGEEEKTTSGPVDTGGRLQLTETFFDFGTVPVGQQVQRKFDIKNTGTGPLNLGQMSVKRLEGC